MRRAAITLNLVLLITPTTFLCAQSGTPPSLPRAIHPVRALRVVLYPFIPGFQSSAEYVKTRFELAHPDVTLQIVDLSSNYYGSNDPNYIGNASADVYELDSVLLQDFVASNKIVPLPAGALLPPEQLLKNADAGTRLDGKRYGAAHWVCRDFLFFATSDAPHTQIKTLSDLKSFVGTGKLLLDLRGKSTLGEYYLVSSIDRFSGFDPTSMPYIDKIDPSLEGDVLSLAKLCDPASCRNPVFHSYTGTHGAEFARKQGKALIGYSESLNAVFTEFNNCSDQTACNGPADIQVADLPLDQAGSTPMTWVDSFTLSATCTGQCVSDATDFIEMMNEDETYRSLLFPSTLSFLTPSQPSDSVPAYLLPAKASLYSDPSVLSRAPLYKNFRPLVENALVPTAPHLNDKLRAVGKKIDGDLP